MKTRSFLIILACILFMPENLFPQDKMLTKSKQAIDAYNSGLQNYSHNNYNIAEKYFLSAINADSQFIDAYLVLAQVYEDSKQSLKAIEIYRKGLPIRKDYFPNGYIRLAKLEFSEGLYTDAEESYKQFLSLNPDNNKNIEKAKDGIARCKFSIEAMKHPVDFKPVNLGPSVNSTMDEYWPSLSADGQTLVITRLVKSDHGSNKVQEDFFISHWQGNDWGVMMNAGSPLNTNDNEGAQALSGDGRYMVFTACNRSDGLGRCDLYYTVREGDKWSVPRNMGKQINSPYRETQPSLSPDGRTLYFASDRPGGKGLHDIWVSYCDENDNWTQPENLGDSVNTSGIEMSPFIHPDNQSLYLSSDGFIGLGGYDLFISRKDSAGKWQKAVNLGYPINTNHDEIGLIINASGDKAYYASDFDKANGKDIYMFDLPEKNRPLMVTYMKGHVIDANSGQMLKAQLELIDLETGQTLYKSFSDSITGEFVVSIPTNRNYMLSASRKGYLFFSENFALKGIYTANKPYLKDILLQPLQIGKSIILKNVFYETDSFALRKESATELNKVVKLMQQYPGIRIEISGHTDNTGNAEYNYKLSDNRAKTVASYLIAASIDSNRIVSKGFGMSMPVATNETEEGRAQNRRTELKIIE
jgi:outer membrane protein OmpA-like peptidoglycan-associated protein